MDIEDFVAYLVLAVFLALIGFGVYKVITEPTCTELGGKSEFSHMLPVWSGKSVVYVPQYNCVMPEKQNENPNPRTP